MPAWTLGCEAKTTPAITPLPGSRSIFEASYYSPSIFFARPADLVPPFGSVQAPAHADLYYCAFIFSAGCDDFITRSTLWGRPTGTRPSWNRPLKTDC